MQILEISEDDATATHCNALQRTATHCNALQHTVPHCTKKSSAIQISESSEEDSTDEYVCTKNGANISISAKVPFMSAKEPCKSAAIQISESSEEDSTDDELNARGQLWSRFGAPKMAPPCPYPQNRLSFPQKSPANPQQSLKATRNTSAAIPQEMARTFPSPPNSLLCPHTSPSFPPKGRANPQKSPASMRNTPAAIPPSVKKTKCQKKNLKSRLDTTFTLCNDCTQCLDTH